VSLRVTSSVVVSCFHVSHFHTRLHNPGLNLMTLIFPVVAHQPTPLLPTEALEGTPRPLAFRPKSMTPSTSCGIISPRLSSVRSDLTLCKIKQVGFFCDFFASHSPTLPSLCQNVIALDADTHELLFVLSDNLAVSAQGFRRNANRVRKVCLVFALSLAIAE